MHQSYKALPPKAGRAIASHYSTVGFSSNPKCKQKANSKLGHESNKTVDQVSPWGGLGNDICSQTAVSANYATNQYSNENHSKMTNRFTASTLMHMTDAHKKKFNHEAPPIKNAKYHLSVRSSVSRANSGKIESLGTFQDRAKAIVQKNQASASNFLYQNNPSPSQYDTYQIKVQPRGRSQLNIKDLALGSGKTQSKHIGSSKASAISSTNIRGGRYPTNQISNSKHNSIMGSGPAAKIARHSSAVPRKAHGSALQNLLVVSGDPCEIQPAQVIDYSQNMHADSDVDVVGSGDNDDTRFLLQKQANQYGMYNAPKGSSKDKEMRVICATESQNERIKLVVVEHSFSEVIRAMYNNDQQRISDSIVTSPNAATGSQRETVRRSIELEAAAAITNLNGTDLESAIQIDEATNSRKPSSSAHRVMASDSTIHLPPGLANTAKQNPTVTVEDPYTDANSLNTGINQVLSPKEEIKVGITATVTDEASKPSELSVLQGRSIKLMDTITFKDEFQPIQWIFTDLMGHIQSKEISQISINEVIKAFLINLNHNKKTDFNNDDLMCFLDKDQIDKKICFAIKGQRRDLLDIKDLLDLRKRYPRGIDALQLFKIPTRSFLPFYFHHILAFDKMGRPLRSTLIRLPIREVQQQMEAKALQGAMSQLKSRSSFVQERILQVSNDIVARLTEVSPVVLLNIVIVYLLEEDKYEPWFIGTEKCEVLTQKITHKRKQQQQGKNQTVKTAQSQFPTDSNVQISRHSHRDQNKSKLDKSTSSKSHTLIDAPAQIRIIETDLVNLNSGGIKMNRGGRTPSTTTVFQKLDSRSHVTTHKNDCTGAISNHETDRYLMMLNGSEENLKNPYSDQRAQTGSSNVQMARQISQEDRLSYNTAYSKQTGLRDRKHHRPKTQIVNQKRDPPPPPEITFPDTTQRLEGIGNAANCELCTTSDFYQRTANNYCDGQESNYSRVQEHAIQHTSQDDESSHQLQQHQMSNQNQSKSLSDKEAPFGPNFYNNQSRAQYEHDKQKNVNSSEINSTKLCDRPQMNNQQINQDEPNQESCQQILQNEKVMEHLREGVIFQADCPTPEQNLIVPVVKEFKQRGKSAIIGGRRQVKTQSNLSQLSKNQKYSDLGHKKNQQHSKAFDQRREEGAEGQNVYMLHSNELLTENELFSGLARIGNEYGREPVKTLNSRQLTAVKAKRSTTSTGFRANTSVSRLTNSSKIRGFIDRQEMLKAMSQETKAQRLMPQAHDNRLMNLFPQFLDKSASRKHAKFLFGDSEQSKVFRNYRNAMNSQETKVKNLIDCMLPQEVIRNDLKLFGVARMNQYGTKIFDFKTSDYDDLQFLEQVVNHKDDISNEILDSRQNLNSTITVGVQEHNKSLGDTMQRPQSTEPDFATMQTKPQNSINTKAKGRDFLAEALHESRMAFQKQSKLHTLFNQIDKNAIVMIEAEKKLDGVVVNDAFRVIEDFHNSKLYNPAHGSGDYNIVGNVPKVNSELAMKYIEMKDAIKRQREFHESQQRILSNSYSQPHYRQTTQRSKSSKSRAQTSTSNQQPNPPVPIRKRAQQGVKTQHNPRIQLNMIEQNKVQQQQHQQRLTSIDSGVQSYKQSQQNNAALQEMIVISNDTDGRRETGPANGMINFGSIGLNDPNSQEMITDTQLHPSDHPQSIDTIDQANSMHRQSLENFGPLGFKCSMGLCCDNTKILISQAMQVEDICYIQQNELSKAKQFLIDERRSEQAIKRYLRHFHNIESPPAGTEPVVHLLQNADLQTTSIMLQERELQVQDPKLLPCDGNESSEVSKRMQPDSEEAYLGSTKVIANEYTSLIDGSGQQAKKSNLNAAKQSNHEALTQRSIKETRTSMHIREDQQKSDQDASIYQLHSLQNEHKTQQTGIHGVEVIKRVDMAALDDSGKNLPPSCNTIYKTPALLKTQTTAQSILKPIEDLSIKNPQIFKHEGITRVNSNIIKESSRERSSLGKSTLEASKTGTPDGTAGMTLPHVRHTSEAVPTSNRSGGEAAGSARQQVDFRLSQLGIRHVKLDQENWVPSPEFIPCCVRCFSIATFVINYESQELINWSTRYPQSSSSHHQKNYEVADNSDAAGIKIQ